MPSTGLGTYLYCIARAEPFSGPMPPLHGRGVAGDGSRPRVVTGGGLAAIVSDSPMTGYDITRETLLAHEQVIAEAMERTDVLPVRFGTVAESDEAIREQLLR